MNSRHDFDDQIDKLQQISSHYSGANFSGKIDSLINMRDSFNIKLLFVGHFNAGKSALLNGLLERHNFLIESQKPQTSLATELRYTVGKEIYQAFANDGTAIMVNPSHSYDATMYTHAEYSLNAKSLEALADYILVDTPGFDSGIENHNKALTYYLGKGSAFILVANIEDGTLSTRSLGFLGEVSNYSDKIAIIMNKCDKKTDTDIESISSQIRDTLDIYGFGNVNVYCLSARDNDISRKLTDIILSFNAEDIFRSRMKKELDNTAASILNSIQLIKRTTALDTYSMDLEINKYKDMRRQSQNKFKRMKEEAESKPCEEIANEIMFKIKSELESHSMEIGRALISGSSDAAQAIVMETMRPVLINELKSVSSVELDSIVEQIKMDLPTETNDSNELGNIIASIAGNLKEAISDGTFDEIGTQIENFREQRNQGKKEQAERSEKGKNLYRAITGITAITTNVIAPWLELIIILAPDIISLITKIFGDSEEDKAEKQVINVIIPQILAKMRGAVNDAVQSSRETIFESIQSIYEQELDGITHNLEQACSDKKSAEASFDLMINNIDSDIQTLKQIMA